MSMPTMIPPTIFSQIAQTKSSPETTAALLNEAESLYSVSQKHFNAKRLYPYWRACPICGSPFSVENNDQFHKRRYCSKDCGYKAISVANTGKRGPTGPRAKMPLSQRKGTIITCPVCGSQVWKAAAWLRKVDTPTCSKHCNGVLRSRELVKHSANGKGKKRPGKGLSGALNPAWKGGVTYFKTHGNYIGVKYVRCPAVFISMARKDGYVMEHRLLVAQAIGRPLLRVEVVHHIDHNPANNALGNLQLFANNRDHKLHEHHGLPPPLWPV